MKQSSLLSLNQKDKRNPRERFLERLQCMKKKGVFPYSWAQSASWYKQPYLVEQKYFFNTLTQTHISDEEYKFAKEVWKTFEMETMGDYCKMYCLTGNIVLLTICRREKSF